MNILLTAVNAKYIHSNPAVHLLKACTDQKKIPGVRIQVAEYTINDRYSDVLAEILGHQPDIIGFSVYIWNVDRVRRLIRDIRKIRGPGIRIWTGGPEATHYPEPFLLEDGADLCMLGEGEAVFAQLVEWVCAVHKDTIVANHDTAIHVNDHTPLIRHADPPLTGQNNMTNNSHNDRTNASFSDIANTVFDENEQLLNKIRETNLRGLALVRNGKIIRTGLAAPVELDSLPFFYRDLTDFTHRILYYESSRGCPFACAYCLSGRERGVRFRSLSLVEEELQFFLDKRVPQVKFIDRTFNADPVHAIRIWQYLRDHDNGVTNFHFEIEGDRITDEELKLLETLRPGLVQLEIGVQSANPETLRSVHRRAEVSRIAEVMAVLTKRQNINLHLDLIAGLPYENLELFRHSFQTVYDMRPHQLQLGFLKLMKGTELYEKRETYGLICSEDSPYEVLKTNWLSFEDLSLLHRISDRVEEYVNSQGFRRSLPLAEKLFEDAFSMFEALADHYKIHGYDHRHPSVFQRYDIFEDFLRTRAEQLGDVPEEQLTSILEMVRFDRFLHTHPSRKMTAYASFSFPEGRVSLHFDYSRPSPVNGEASWHTANPQPGSLSLGGSS